MAKKQIVSNGFTMVELVIVIIVIVILATVAIVGYGSWEKNLAARTVKSDLTAAASAMESAKTWGTVTVGVYPQSLPASFVASNSTNITLASRPGGANFCINGTSYDDPSVAYYISSNQTEPKLGNCNTVRATGTPDTPTSVDFWGTPVSGLGNDLDDIAVDDDGNAYVISVSRNSILKVDASDYSVSAFSGSGATGNNNGPGNVTTWSIPRGIVKYDEDIFLVADSGNSSVRRMSRSDGSTSYFGPVNGQPTSIDVDVYGNAYVGVSGCTGVASIQKITPSGTNTPIAGSGTCGSVDGPALSARFNYIEDLAVDSKGNIYVAESNNCRIRKIASNGEVMTAAGTGACGVTNGPALTSNIVQPKSLYVDKYDNVYIFNYVPGNMRMLTTDGNLLEQPFGSAIYYSHNNLNFVLTDDSIWLLYYWGRVDRYLTP